MNSEIPSHTIYRDHDIHGGAISPAHSVSWQRLGEEDERAERFEVLLRLMLVVCVGAAMLAGGAWAQGAAPTADRAAQRVPVVQPVRVAAEAAATFLPKAMVRAAQTLQ